MSEMTREEARKLRDDNIQFCREGILERPSDEIFEVNDVLEVIDDIIIEIEKCDKNIEALQERPKGRWIEKDGKVYCTACNTGWKLPPLYDLKEHIENHNFCTECGADMRESEQE